MLPVEIYHAGILNINHSNSALIRNVVGKSIDIIWNLLDNRQSLSIVSCGSSIATEWCGWTSIIILTKNVPCRNIPYRHSKYQSL